MFSVIKRTPKNEMNPFDPWFKDFLTTDLWDTGYRYPAVDIYEKDGSVHIDAEVPGVEKENLKVGIEDGVLTIAGETKVENEKKDKNYFRTERHYGSFKRCFTLGENVEDEKIEAHFENGILKVSIPFKAEEKKLTKEITIK
ncbi:MAG: Hsp20/alpha crystallin family protein [Candidatus Wallbacteria bacterium]|nr:Hsp20/alpha crystallin family protein [Candidatus Wallbacteria bacterium]